jgi:hypothetical protein
MSPEDAYSEDGADLTLIRWMLSLTPSERLQVLDDFTDFVTKARAFHAPTEGSESLSRLPLP